MTYSRSSLAKNLLIILMALVFITPTAPGQVRLEYYLPTDVQYDAKIPTPQSFFGFQVGEWHLSPDQIHSYMKVLDAASERITITPMGRTYEQRELWLLTITSPDNHRNIKAIQDQHNALSDPARSGSLNLTSMPVVVWMGYSVHGNEPSGANSSVLVAYYLAAAQGERIEKQLKEVVILLNPSINPDGLNRFATWANMHRGMNAVADPSSREHNEVWPGGRSNHYWFDLNRDWMPLQHPESRARLVRYYEWRPNVLTDHHEMGTNTTFFFQPGVPSRNNPLGIKRTTELTEAIARYHAQALDRIGSLYYSGEGYDDFYIGKGSSYPDLTGSIGILFEQASSRGHVQESIHGDLTFPFTIRNQFTTSLSTLEASVALRSELLIHQRDFYSSAVKDAEKSPIKAYLFGSSSDPARNSHLLDILTRHQIEVYELAKQTRVDGNTFEPGKAYIVPTGQPQFRLVTSLFEKRTKFDDSLFYDISSWTLPLAFNLPSAEIRNAVRELAGTKITSATPGNGSLVGGNASYAYAFAWDSYFAPRTLYRLLKKGIVAKVGTKTFEADTENGRKQFNYGTILIPLGIQHEKAALIRTTLDQAVKDDGITAYALNSGLSMDGVDLGSASFATLTLPKIGLIVGTGVSPTDVGEAWHLLDNRFGIDISLLETTSLGRLELSRYTAIVMTGGNYGGLESSAVEALKKWNENGGTLIALEQAVEWAINNKLSAAALRKGATGRDTVAGRKTYADEDKFSGALNVAGAIFQARYDRTHPLLYGYTDSLMSVFLGSSVFLEPSKNPYATPVAYTAAPLLSGYMHKSYDKQLQNSGVVVVSSSRTGRTILMTINPNFRAFWYGTNKLFLNSLFFGPVIRGSSARGEE
jgi:hypothetical protein